MLSMAYVGGVQAQAECRARSYGSCTDARRQGILSSEYPRHDLGSGHTLWVLLKQVCVCGGVFFPLWIFSSKRKSGAKNFENFTARASKAEK